MLPSAEEPVCRICEEKVAPDEDWCFGCKSFICEVCVMDGPYLTGSHHYTDHVQGGDEDAIH
jgi:hypothetical protein